METNEIGRGGGMEIGTLRKKDKCVFAVKMAERASRYFEDAKTASLIDNAIEIASAYIRTEKGDGELLYNFLDNENDGFTVLQEMEADEKTKDAWDCIIDAIAYVAKEAYLANGEKYFPEPIEMVDDTVFAHMTDALKKCSPEEAKFIEGLYNACLGNKA